MAGLPELAAGSHRRSGAPLPIAPRFSFFCRSWPQDLRSLQPLPVVRVIFCSCSRQERGAGTAAASVPVPVILAALAFVSVLLPRVYILPLLRRCRCLSYLRHCLRYYRQPLQLLRV